MGVWVYGWMGGWADRWMGGSVDRWVGGSVDRWIGVDGVRAGLTSRSAATLMDATGTVLVMCGISTLMVLPVSIRSSTSRQCFPESVLISMPMVKSEG